MKKILVLTDGDIYERRGFFNAVINRTKHLKEIIGNDCSIDLLLLGVYEPWYVRKLRHTDKRECPNSIVIDDININILWRRFYLLDYIIKIKLHKLPYFRNRFLSKIPRYLKDYDFVISHSIDCGLIALSAKEKYGVPFSVTWHGSEIHTAPFQNPPLFNETVRVLENANINLFVSNALLKVSEKITINGRKIVLYNGCDKRFKRFSDQERIELRTKYNVLDKKVVVFAGNFVVVKNILQIPHIFREIHEKDKNVVFWMIGDGKLRQDVETLSEGLPVRFWGNQEPELIPSFFNASDVFILPSLNEGLPLTTIEALKCGCHVVGSLVGGIPEVIGEENCVSLSNPDFAKRFAERVLYFLNEGSNAIHEIKSCFDWTEAAKQEIDIIKQVIHI